MILIINTCEDNYSIKISANNKEQEISWSGGDLSVDLIVNIEKILKESRNTYFDLNSIYVCSGPGKFTATRIGVATANALGYGLNIAVVGFNKANNVSFKDNDKKPFTCPAKAEYISEPHITVKK
ncbi:MAG: tRNA (adenosine(37)-N6)-threonylcarbamoyltransferase complex dimerization subunit type 1 TsaB [Patescibacteria group bacterium]|jgi:tRNA threonylcarbamoyl adenosine modification protein YeaZ